MAKQNTPFRYKLAAALLDKGKGFIPHLNDTLQAFDSGHSIKNYRAKQEAITANLGWASLPTTPSFVLRRRSNSSSTASRRTVIAKSCCNTRSWMDLMKRPNGALKG